MKSFGVALLQLDTVSSDTGLQAAKQAIRPNTQFFNSLSLHPPASIDELFQIANQYAMLEDDVVAATKRMVLVRPAIEAAVEARERKADGMRTLSTNVTTKSRFMLQEPGGKPA